MWVNKLKSFLIEHGVYDEFISADCPNWYRESSSIRSVINESVPWEVQKKATGTSWRYLHDLWASSIKDTTKNIGISHKELIKALTKNYKIDKVFKEIRKLRPLH